MIENNLMLHKNKDLIEITTDQITKQQLKAFNYIAYKAKKELKRDNDKRNFYFSYSEFKTAINCSETNNKYVFDILKKLSNTEVSLIKDARNWATFSLISEAVRKEEKILIQLANTMCDCLLEKNYTTLNLEIIKNFNSKYTILFYETYEKYKDINFPILTISDFKKFCGIDNKKTFNNFSEVKRKILKPALQELAQKEKIYINYKLTKKGKAYETIQFYITAKKDDFKLESSPMTDDEIHIQFEKFKRENKNYQELMKSSKKHIQDKTKL